MTNPTIPTHATMVKADSIEDYLTRYYRPERMTPTLLQSYKEELEQNGHVETSRHDNILGVHIAWKPTTSKR